MYYSHSLLLRPSTAAYNNRALMYIKLERHSEAVEDCTKVLEEDPNNVKGILVCLPCLSTYLIVGTCDTWERGKGGSVFY